jgi:putative DNA primase/helicase
MPDNQTVVSIGLIREVFTSEFTPQLFGGVDTHEPALRLVAQLVRYTLDDNLIESVVAAALPEAYSGDTLAELPRMIADARKKGFDKTAPKRAEFEMTESGLVFFKLTGKSVIPTDVSDPLEILGLVRDAKSARWARLLRWRDADGNEHEFIASDKQLLSDHDVVCGDMAEQGLRISKGQQGNLARYISASKTDVRITLVNRIGWHGIGERDIFVLPSQVIGNPPSRVIYEANDKRHEDYSVRGTLSDWRHAVSIPAGQHPLPTLAISASLTGPLLHLAGLESGGIHLFGNSSTGKTTLLKLAASVWGNANLVRSWRATGNGLEVIANQTSDVSLILDELGQLDSKDAATALYMLASGVGKIRMTRNATLQDIKTWRAFILSSGEMTVEAKITQLRGAKAYAGATLRLLNVGADRGLGFGVFDNAGPTGDVRDLVNAFAAAAALAYGVAGPEFVRALISRALESAAIQNAIDHFVQSNVEHDASGQVVRAAKRFGLIATAGELATEFGITGWLPGTAAAAAAAAFKKWVEVRGGDGKEPAEDRAAIRQVTELIVRYGESRFDELDERGFNVEPAWNGDSEGSSPPPPRPAVIRLGWRKYEGEKRIWMIEDAVWESEFCRGFDPVQVSRALERHEMLKCAKGRFTYAERFQDKRNKRFHIITAKVLTSDYDRTPEDEPDDNDGVPERPGRPSY